MEDIIVLEKYVVKKDRRYTETDEWVLVDEDIATIGITDYAQRKLRDIVGVELPEKDTEVKKGESVANIESIKTVAEVYAPVSGTVIEVNTRLLEEPELLNNDPYGDGWILKIRITSMDEVESLLTPEQYAEHIASREAEK